MPTRRNKIIRSRKQKPNIQLSGTGRILAASQEESSLPTFKMTAYNGGSIDVGWGDPVVIDLAGVTHAEKIPILASHGEPIGHSETVTVGKKSIGISGVLSFAGNETHVADDFARAARNGFPWQASIGAQPVRGEVYYVEEKAKVEANGRTFKGPLYYVAQSVLFESSFVALGADSSTSVSVAANRRETKMTFQEWLEANYPELDFMAEAADRQSEIFAEYQADRGGSNLPRTPASPVVPPRSAGASPVTASVPSVHGGSNGVSDDDRDVLAERAAQYARISQIEAKARQYPTIMAEILADESAGRPWSDTQIENRIQLQQLRDNRSTAPGVGGGGGASVEKSAVIAALCLGAGCDEKSLIAKYGDQVVERADAFRHVGLRGAIELWAAAQGQQMPSYSMGQREWIRAATTSSINAPSLFEEAVSRTLESMIPTQPPLSEEIAVNRPVRDFRKVTRYLLAGGEPWREVTKDGKLQHTMFGEPVKMEVQATTFGQILVFTRQDVINDDLGAIAQFTEMMGNGWNDVITSEMGKILYNKAFIGANYANSTDAAFDYPTLKATMDTMRTTRIAMSDFANAESRSRVVGAKFVIHGGALTTSAEELWGAERITLLSSGEEIVVRNPFNNVLRRFEFAEAGNPEWFADSATYYTPYDDSWWMTAGNTGHFCPIELSWLNGRRVPTVESFQMGEEYLGFGIRGYGDFGANALRNEGIYLFQPSDSA